MGEVRVTDRVDQDWVRCSADEFGAFIDGLAALTDPARDREVERATVRHRDWIKEIATQDGVSQDYRDRETARAQQDLESARQRVIDSYLPAWSTTVRGRRVEARGAWATVRDELDFSTGGTARIGMGKESSLPAFTVLLLNRGLRIEVAASSSKWLDENVPVIRHRLARFRPRGGWYPRLVNTVVLFVTACVTLFCGVVALLTSNFDLAGVGLAVSVPMVAALWISNLPAIRFGPAPTRWWLTAGKWVLVTSAGAILGGVLTKLIGLD